MGQAQSHPPVNLICGILSQRTEWMEAALDRLEKAFGRVDLRSEIWPFDFTDYYTPQMGAPLLRQFYSFRELIAPENLVVIKHTTNRLERELAEQLEGAPPRPVNLDPGYLCRAKLVLATTKDYGHRLYLGGGIYAECTLRWHRGAFQPWEWTYPDYRTEGCRAFFSRVRALYEEKLKSL